MTRTALLRAAAPSLVPGVSHELARWRAARIGGVRYALDLSLAAGAPELQGTLTLSFSLRRPRGDRQDLPLDWRAAPGRLSALVLNDTPIAAREQDEHLVLPGDALRHGRNELKLSFRAPVGAAGTAVTRYSDREDGSEYLYTLFVPSDASSVFPCFDQPDLKARFTLLATLPVRWNMVSNGTEVVDEAAAHEAATPATRRVRFAETEPISTYLFAFAAGPFEALTAPGEPVRLFVRRSQKQKAIAHAAEVLRLNRAATSRLADYFAHPFPFAKYDLVLVPELAYGGMEHAGATFLREDAVLFPSEPSAQDLLRRAQLVFHETSHQWFGDLVTMRWFDDLWLKEGFANLMAAKLTASLLPEVNAWNAFHQLKLAAYRTDVTPGTTPIHQPLDNLADAKSAYGAIVYSKGPAFLRQAEFYLGEAAFRDAVRALVKHHAYGAADWRDLVRAFEQASGRKLARRADAWVNRRGVPTLTLDWKRAADGRIARVQLRQQDSLGEGSVWPMKLLVIALLGPDASRVVEVRMDRGSATVPGLAGAPAPTLLYANHADYGYGRFLLDRASRDAVLADPGIVRGELLRPLVLGSLWEAVRDAEVAPLAYIGLAMRLLPQERDELTQAALLARVQAACERYLSAAQRDALAPRLEALLVERMLQAGKHTERITWLRALIELAWSPDGLARLRELLDGGLIVPGVALSQRDRFRLLRTLLARGDDRAPGRLAALAAADTSGNAQRWAFGTAAAAPSADQKRLLFRRFLDDASLQESWIEEALPGLNRSGQEALTLPLLEEALSVLPMLKRRHRIFFINNWLDAFVGGQSDARALSLVDARIADASMDEDLRRKLMEAADGLRRAVRIRAVHAG
jgi:aminopeptidase N